MDTTLLAPVAEFVPGWPEIYCQYFTTVTSGSNSFVWVAVCYFTAS
jgi:hypothetical protein